MKCQPRAADPSALGVFYRRYERPVLANFRRRTGDSELAPIRLDDVDLPE